MSILPELYRCMHLQVLFAILLAALGIAQAQMSFPDITQAAAAIERVFGTIDRKTSIDSGSDAGTHVFPAFEQRRDVYPMLTLTLIPCMLQLVLACIHVPYL